MSNIDIYDSIDEYEIYNFHNNENFSSPNFPPQTLEIYNANQINNLYEDVNLINNNVIPSYYLIKQEEMEKNSIPKCTKATTTKTNQNKQEKDEPKVEPKDEPKLYTSNDILNIFNDQSNKDKISDSFKTLKFKENIEDDLRLTKNKGKMDYYDYINSKLSNKKNNEIKKKKRGREKKNVNITIIHDKMCSDNIIKKIKSAIFNYTLCFLNTLLSLTDEKCSIYNIKLSKIHYKKNIDILKKEKELEILNMSLKEIFSKDISPKLRKYNSNFNKQIIENILNNKKVNDTILFVFNMTLRNWLDIFTLKKSVIDIINEYSDKNYKNIDFDKIEKSMVGIDKLLNEIKEKNGEDYLPYFIFCLYNYERWFNLKKSRKNKKNQKQI